MTEPTPSSMTLILVGDDATFREVRLNADDARDILTALQTLVDGWIECVSNSLQTGEPSSRRRDVDMWLNEEGKLRSDLAANLPALGLLDRPTGDMFVGPVILATSDNDGHTVGLDDEIIATAKRDLLRLGATELAPASVAEAAVHQAAARQERLDAGYEGHGYGPHIEVAGIPHPHDMDL